MKTSLRTGVGAIRRRNTRRALAGFSLTEVTVGLGIIGTCVAALFSGFTTGFFTIKMSRENLRATQILLQKAEAIRLQSWDQITNPTNIPTAFIDRYDPNSVNSPGVIYNGTIIITNCPISSSYSNSLRMVTISVNWQTGALDRSRTYTTYVARNGLQVYIY
jgi:type II secretory pathway pseudopilin PulG